MGFSGEYHICIFYTSPNQLEFGVEMFPKSVSNDDTCYLLNLRIVCICVYEFIHHITIVFEVV